MAGTELAILQQNGQTVNAPVNTWPAAQAAPVPGGTVQGNNTTGTLVPGPLNNPVLGTPVGGPQGAGTLNAQGIYVNGVPIGTSASIQNGQILGNNTGGVGSASGIYTLPSALLYSPISIYAINSGPCDGVTDQWPAIATLQSQGINRILLPKGCVAYPPSNLIPNNLELIGEDEQACVLISTPVTVGLTIGANARVTRCAYTSNFCTTGVDPITVYKFCPTKSAYNQEDVYGVANYGANDFTSWPGEDTTQVGPFMSGPSPLVGFTTNLVGQTSGIVVSGTAGLFAAGSRTYTLIFQDGTANGQIRSVVYTSGTNTVTWSGALTGTNITTAKIEMIAFTSSVGGLSSGTLTYPISNTPLGDSDFYYFSFNEGGGVVEYRTVQVTGATNCTFGGTAGNCGTAATWSPNLASRTILSATVETSDVPGKSMVGQGSGDINYCSTHNQIPGTNENCMRIVTKTPVGGGVDQGIYCLNGGENVAQATAGVQHRCIIIKNFTDGTISPAQQAGLYIDNVGSALNSGTAIVEDDTGSQPTAGSTRPINSFVFNNAASGNMFDINQGVSGTRTYTGNVFDASMNQNGTSTFSGKFLHCVNNSSVVCDIDASGNITAGTYNGVTIGPATKYNLAQWGVPFILTPSGTFSSNGALTVGTTLPTTFTGGFWGYYPQGAINTTVSAPGYAAGWYWTVCAGPTTCTAYNSVYTSGIPTAGTTTAFSGVTGVAYTQTISSYIPGPTISMPAGSMGPNGALFVDLTNSRNTGGAGSVLMQLVLNLTVQATSNILTTNYWGGGMHRVIRNMGVNNQQVQYAFGGALNSDSTASSNGPSFSTVATGSTQPVIIQMQLQTATDFEILFGGTIEVDYAP